MIASVLPDSATVADGRLAVGGVALGDLAARHGTPLLVYDEATLRARARAYREGLEAYPGPSRLAFACKAQTTVAVLRVLLEEGLGMDVASEGELAFAVAAGAPSERLIVHGNNKSDADVAAALAAEAGLLAADHDAELDQIERLAAAAGRVQPVLVRVNPAIDADTHRKIATGHAASKFGLAPAEAAAALRRAAGLDHVRPMGLHVHLGSQIGSVETYLEAAAWLAAFIDREGLGELPLLDLGGGLAIAYADGDTAPDIREAVAAAAAGVAEQLRSRGLPLPELILEPGRSIAGPSGVTLYTVGAIKRTAAGVTYAAVDGGMADNPRPAMYGARYQAFAVDRAGDAAAHTYAIAGKHCESGDVLVEAAALPELRPGDVIALAATGAYTATMASTYNGLPRPAAVMVADGAERTVVARETVSDLLGRERYEA
ncbi:MAG TPA: diaminopimelate decarboxylase [Gaiellales bacterium]|nr:diaminopimelate decarboxylase [Gaiellales bacterium]